MSLDLDASWSGKFQFETDNLLIQLFETRAKDTYLILEVKLMDGWKAG